LKAALICEGFWARDAETGGGAVVTVLLTLAVPEAADPQDAAARFADAAATTALEVRLAGSHSLRAWAWCATAESS